MRIQRVILAVGSGGTTRTTTSHPFALSAHALASTLAFGSVGAVTIELVPFFAGTLTRSPLRKSPCIRNTSALSFDADGTDTQPFFGVSDLAGRIVALTKPPC